MKNINVQIIITTILLGLQALSHLNYNNFVANKFDKLSRVIIKSLDLISDLQARVKELEETKKSV